MKLIVSAFLSALLSIGMFIPVFAADSSSLFDMTDNEKTEYIVQYLDSNLIHMSRLVTLTSNQMYDEIKNEVALSVKDNLSAEEIKEAIYQSAPYCGYMRTVKAMNTADAALDELGISIPNKSRKTVTDATRYENGLAIQRQFFGQQIGTVTSDMNSAQKLQTIYLSGICFGDFYTRSGLDLNTREFLTFCTIAANGGCDSQAQAHAAVNINIGHSDKMLYAAALANADINGETKTNEILKIIETVK